jgi:hypothetical protein
MVCWYVVADMVVINLRCKVSGMGVTVRVGFWGVDLLIFQPEIENHRAYRLAFPFVEL